MNKIIILTCAPSGAGKTTWAKKFIELNPNYVYICPDLMRKIVTGDELNQENNYKVFHVLEIMASYFMSLNMSLFVDATCYNCQNRKTWVKLARRNGYKIIAYVFKTTIDECLRRNEYRECQRPKNVILNQFNGFQMPTLEEVDEIIEIT